VNKTVGVAPEDALGGLTEQIQVLTKQFGTTPKDPACAELLASVYAYRGIVWRIKLQKDKDKKSLDDNDVKDFTESLRLDPIQPNVYTHRAVSLFGRDRAEDAVDDLDRALRISGTSAWPYYQRAKFRIDGIKGSLKKYASALEAKDTEWRQANKTEKEQKNVEKALTKEVAARKKAVALANSDRDLQNTDLALAKQAFDLEKESWTRATKPVAKAMTNNNYLAQAQANYSRREKDFDFAIMQWRIARDRAIRASRELDNAAEALDDAGKNLDKATQKATEAKTARADARGKVSEAKADLEKSIADYNETLRLEPSAAIASTERDAAFADLKTATDLLKNYPEKQPDN
jgi:hypothetical protein